MEGVGAELVNFLKGSKSKIKKDFFFVGGGGGGGG